MDSDTDYEAEAIACLENADDFPDGEPQRANWTAKAQVYATLHLADVMRPRQELALDPFTATDRLGVGSLQDRGIG